MVETDPRAPTRGQHAFIQSLIREVAYATLSKRDRRTRHLAAARYFESLDDDELAGALATHYIAAYRAAPEGPEGEAAAAQARIALRAAADRAEALGALGQAVDALRAAIEVTPDPAEHPAILIRIGSIEGFSARYEAADRDLVAAQELATRLGDRAGAVEAAALRSSAYLSVGLIGRGLALAEETEADAEALADDPTARAALAAYAEIRARALFRAERYAECIPWTDRALALADPLRLDFVVAMALVTKGTSLTYLGRRREGLALLNGAYLDASARGLHIPALRAGNNLASTLGEDDPRSSLEWTRKGIVLARRLGLVSFDTYHASNASIAIRTGEWAWLREVIAELLQSHQDPSVSSWIRDMALEQGSWMGEDLNGRPQAMVAHGESAGDPQQLVNGLAWCVDEAIGAGDYPSANRFGQRLLDHEFAGPRTRFWAGRAALLDRDAATAGRVAATLEPSIGGACDADLLALRAGLAALAGQVDEALDGYRASLGIYSEMGLPFDVAMTALDMAELIGPGQATVRAAAADARDILIELGARPLVERLDRLIVKPTAAAEGRAAPPSAGDAARVRGTPEPGTVGGG